jgi:hypothetical protein
MKKQTHLARLCGLAMLCGHAAQAQDAGFTWDAEIEIGVDSTVSSDDPTAEFSDLYLSIEPLSRRRSPTASPPLAG